MGRDERRNASDVKRNIGEEWYQLTEVKTRCLVIKGNVLSDNQGFPQDDLTGTAHLFNMTG